MSEMPRDQYIYVWALRFINRLRQLKLKWFRGKVYILT